MSYLIDIFNVLTAVVALASTIAALTPSKVDDSWVAKAQKFVNVLAINIGQAKK